jgi:hypothetical protein
MNHGDVQRIEDKERSLVGESCDRYMIGMVLKCNLWAGDSHYGRVLEQFR